MDDNRNSDPLPVPAAPEAEPVAGTAVPVVAEEAVGRSSGPQEEGGQSAPQDGGAPEASASRRRERLPIPAFHATWVVAVAGLSFALYLGTLCRGIFPGEPALLTALHSSAAPLPALTHPLWDAVVRLADRGPPATLSLRLNLFSAFCGAVAVALLFHLLVGFRTGLSSAAARMRRTLEGDEWIRRAPARPGDSVLRHAPAMIGAILLAGSFPFWFVSTRAHTGAFGLALVLLGAVMVARYHRTGGRWAILMAAVVMGLSLAETPTSLFLTPATAVWALAAMVDRGDLVLPFMTYGRRRRPRVALPWGFLGAGFVAAATPILIRAAFLLGEPAAEWADVEGYGAALVEVLRAMWIESRALVPRLGWLLLAVTVVVPVVLVGVSSRGERRGRRWLPLLAYSFASVFGIVLAFDVPLAPWPLFGLSPLYITPYAVVALWTAAAAAGFLRLWIRDLERTDLPVWLSKHNLTPEVRRRVAWGYCTAMGLAVILAAGRHAGPIRGASSAMFDTFAAGVIEESAGCDWIVSASPFEHVLSVAAKARGTRVRILDARMGRTPAYMRFVASSFAADPRMRSLSDAGIDAVLLDWFAQGTGLTERVAVLDMPDLWTTGGYAAMPGRTLYRGVRKLDPGIVAERIADLGTWTNRLGEMRRQIDALPPVLRPYGRWIGVHSGRLLNDVGVLCEDVGRPDDAMSVYAAVAEHDPDNYSARRNRERLAREQGGAGAEEFKADLDAVVRRLGGRVEPAFMSRIHGRIRDPGTAMARGLRAAAGGHVDVALAELLEAVRISDDKATRMALAAILERRGEIDESRKVVEGVASGDPSYVPADLAGTALALHAGDLVAAAAGISRAAARPETAAAAGVLSVLLEVKRDDLKAASTLLVRLQSERPDDPALMSMAAYVAWRRGDAEALRVADQSLRRRNVRLPLVSVLVAASEAAQGRRREARERLEETTARHPSYAPAWEALLRLDYVERRQDMAREHVARILRLRPDHALANQFLASFQMEEGRLPEAEAALLVALRGAPGDSSVLNDLAWCLIEQGRHAEALPYARRAAEASPDSAEILDTLGIALMETGELQAASEVLTRAVGLRPKDATIRGHLEDVRIREAAASASGRKPPDGRPE